MGRMDAPRSSPLAYDGSVAPSFFIAHGDHDTYTPVTQARELVSHLQSTSGRPIVYAELPGGQHAFDLLRSVRFAAVVDGIDAFLAWLYGSRLWDLADQGSETRLPDD